MASFLDVKNGLYDPSKRFAFTNITAEVFESAWDGQKIIVNPSQTIELTHHLAVKLTGELVDKIMIGNAKLDELQHKEPYFRSPQGTSLGVPAARKVWEDQILRELQVDEESPEIQIMRAKIREELISDMKKEPSKEGVTAPTSVGEFADATAPQPKKEKRAYKTKTIKVEESK